MSVVKRTFTEERKCLEGKFKLLGRDSLSTNCKMYFPPLFVYLISIYIQANYILYMWVYPLDLKKS